MPLSFLRFHHATTQTFPSDCFDPVCCCQVWCQLCLPLHFCKFARPSVCPFGMLIWFAIWLQKFKHCSKLLLLKENSHIWWCSPFSKGKVWSLQWGQAGLPLVAQLSFSSQNCQCQLPWLLPTSHFSSVWDPPNKNQWLWRSSLSICHRSVWWSLVSSLGSSNRCCHSSPARLCFLQMAISVKLDFNMCNNL